MSSGVQFEEDNLNFSKPHPTSPGGSSSQSTTSAQFANYSRFGGHNSSKMVQWLIKKGVVKSPNSAQAILILVVIINTLITFVVIKYLI